MGVDGRRKSTFTTAPAAGRRTISRGGRVRCGVVRRTVKIYGADAEPNGQSPGRTATGRVAIWLLLPCGGAQRTLPRKGAFMSPCPRSVRALLPRAMTSSLRSQSAGPLPACLATQTPSIQQSSVPRSRAAIRCRRNDAVRGFENGTQFAGTASVCDSVFPAPVVT